MSDFNNQVNRTDDTWVIPVKVFTKSLRHDSAGYHHVMLLENGLSSYAGINYPTERVV